MSAGAAERLRLALAQVNPTVGDIDGNRRLVAERIAEAREAGAQLLVAPELVLSGYPPEDLVLKRHFLDAVGAALHDLAAQTHGIVALVGFPERDAYVHNSMAVLADGEVKAVYRKILLPNYGVFDERRNFEPGDSPSLISLGETLVGLTICEDIWFAGPPSSTETRSGARLIVNASGSPYHHGKGSEREEIVAARARECGIPFALCNAVGAQDELVFDGQSLVVDASGQTISRASQFNEELLVCDLELPPATADGGHAGGRTASVIAAVDSYAPQADPIPAEVAPALEPDEAEVYAALKIGLRDYVEKNGFKHVVIALSGGIDSALVALIAVDALGAQRVSCVVMPSPHSSEGTQGDARTIAANLGVQLIEIPIEAGMDAYGAMLAEPFRNAEGDPGLAEENAQARIRGNLVMALSNRFGWLVLTTGNKSELSVGYATLYGDMAGGFGVIKDVFKTLVFRLVRHRNEIAAGEPPIPASVLERPPSAELRPDQKDEDSLPPYDILDGILEAYVERDQGRDQIVAAGFDSETVDEVIRLVDRAEYKRRQAPPGIKISTKAFGRDRRLPITNRFGG